MIDRNACPISRRSRHPVKAHRYACPISRRSGPFARCRRAPRRRVVTLARSADDRDELRRHVVTLARSADDRDRTPRSLRRDPARRRYAYPISRQSRQTIATMVSLCLLDQPTIETSLPVATTTREPRCRYACPISRRSGHSARRQALFGAVVTLARSADDRDTSRARARARGRYACPISRRSGPPRGRGTSAKHPDQPTIGTTTRSRRRSHPTIGTRRARYAHVKQ
jgi:hypothetical protein